MSDYSVGAGVLDRPATQGNHLKAMYGEIAAFCEIAVHFMRLFIFTAREGQAPPLRAKSILQRALYALFLNTKNLLMT